MKNSLMLDRKYKHWYIQSIKVFVYDKYMTFVIKEKTDNYKEHICGDRENPTHQCWTVRIPETVVFDNGMVATFDFRVLYAYDGSYTYTMVLDTKITLNDEEIQDDTLIIKITNFLQETYFDYSVYNKPEFIFDSDQEE